MKKGRFLSEAKLFKEPYLGFKDLKRSARTCVGVGNPQDKLHLTQKGNKVRNQFLFDYYYRNLTLFDKYLKNIFGPKYEPKYKVTRSGTNYFFF